MPSGKPIDWNLYDAIIVEHLPKHTIAEFTKQFLPHIASRTICTRAKRLGVASLPYVPTNDHKKAIAASVAKIGPTEVAKIEELRDTHSIVQIAAILGVDDLTIHRTVAKYGIKLSEEGYARARLASTVGSIGKIPWNKDGTLSQETKDKISVAISGDRNGQYGRGMTEEEKERWRIAYFSEGVEKMRQWFQSEAGQSIITRLKSPEWREAQSKRMSQLMLDGVISPYPYCKQSRLVTHKGGEFTTKSSYETKYVEILEADEAVLAFIYEPFRIPYEFDGVILNYIPDFLVKYVDREELVEVKPKRMVDWPKNQAKFEAGEDYHVGFRVVSEEDLGL